MKIIIAGGKGLLGRNIAPVLGAFSDLIIFDIEEWDITDKSRGEAILSQHRPDVLINLAAVTDVDGCEEQREIAQKVNGEGPGILAGICHTKGIGFVHMSTDYVFDGRKRSPYGEEDEPNPLSVYGDTKLIGERNTLRACPSSVIVRAQWLYGRGGPNFITKVMKVAEEKGVVEVVDDQRGCPTYAHDIGLALAALLQRARSGIYHAANGGSCTWFDFAVEIFRQKGIDVEVRPITSNFLHRKAKRPAYSVFDCSKLKRDTDVQLRSWQAALREYLTEGE